MGPLSQRAGRRWLVPAELACTAGDRATAGGHGAGHGFAFVLGIGAACTRSETPGAPNAWRTLQASGAGPHCDREKHEDRVRDPGPGFIQDEGHPRFVRDGGAVEESTHSADARSEDAERNRREVDREGDPQSTRGVRVPERLQRFGWDQQRVGVPAPEQLRDGLVRE